MAVAVLAFAGGLAGGGALVPAALFVLFYGAGHGILSITQGTLPLLIFDHRVYGARTGALLVPGFVAAALAPFVFAIVIESFDTHTALWACIALALAAMLAAIALNRLLR